VIGEVAPRADAGRVAEFLRGIYAETIDEERVERERFLKEVIPQFRANPPADEVTPEAARPEPVPARPSRVVPKAAAPAPPPEAPRPPRTSQSVRLPGLPGLPPTVAPPAPASNGAPIRRLTTPKASPAPGLAPPPTSGKSTLGARLIAGCRLIRPLSEGRLGSVHVGMRAGSTDEVSVRLLESLKGLDAAAVERIRAEANKVAGPNVVAISAAGLGDGGTLYFVGDPIGGTDLANIMRVERRLEGGRALDIAIQISRALGAAHSASVLHHHLEPERVLVATSPTGDKVKVLDFGLAGRHEAPGAIEATSALYRAPEQLLGHPADARADVYAAAAILYEMVTGAPPHAASPDPIARKLAEPAQSPRMFRPEIPAELEALIMASLDRDPAARPATIAAFEQALTAVSRTRDAEPAADEAARASAPAASPDRRRARREAAFRVIGELATAIEQPEADLLPPLIDGPPLPPEESSERATPLRVPSVALIALTESAPSAPAPVPAAAPSLLSAAPVPQAAVSREFGGAMLARYGAEEGTRWPAARVVPWVVVGLVVAAGVAFMLLR
jgi:serine/threonine-protein kinase